MLMLEVGQGVGAPLLPGLADKFPVRHLRAHRHA